MNFPIDFNRIVRIAITISVLLSQTISIKANIAVLDMEGRNSGEQETSGDYSCQLYSAQYLCDIAGYPYFVTKELSEAMKADVIMFASVVCQTSFTDEEWESIEDWLESGGAMLSPAIRSFDADGCQWIDRIYGIDTSHSIEKSSDRKLICWNEDYMEDEELEYFDEAEEKETSIGNVKSFGFKAGECDVLANFSNGDPAVIRKWHGKGRSYMVPVAWRDVVARNQLNKDQSASRCYNNGFEPSSDIWAFFLRSIHAAHVGVSAWKFTSPGGYLQVLVPTHDCDSRTAFQEMHWMGDYEKSLGLRGHYFLTTHYYSDKKVFGHEYLSDFYDETGIANAMKLFSAGHTMGSHSVCHFPDFASVRNTDIVTRDEYAARATCIDGKSTGASSWAEIVMSKNIIEEDFGNRVRSFRSGHLCVNPDFHPMMEEGGYEFQSCYTAGDLLSEFPFFGRMDNQWGSALSNVLTIPLHISDVYNEKTGTPLNNDTWETHPAPDQWAEAMRKLRGNYASAVLLIHPNREWKMTLEKRLVERLPLDEVGLYNFEDYGDFWKARLEAKYDVEYDADTRTVTIATDLETIERNRMTFAVEKGGEEVASVEFRDNASGRRIESVVKILGNNRLLAVPVTFGSVEEIETSTNQTPGLYDMQGRLVATDNPGNGLYVRVSSSGTDKFMIAH